VRYVAPQEWRFRNTAVETGVRCVETVVERASPERRETLGV
jgi:hypothetical protein